MRNISRTFPAAAGLFMAAGTAGAQLVTFNVEISHEGVSFLETSGLKSVDISVTLNEDIHLTGLLGTAGLPWIVSTSDPDGFHNYKSNVWPETNTTVLSEALLDAVAKFDKRNLDAAIWDTGVGLQLSMDLSTVLAGDNPSPLSFARADDGGNAHSQQFVWASLPNGIVYEAGTTLHILTLTYGADSSLDVSFNLSIQPFPGQNAKAHELHFVLHVGPGELEPTGACCEDFFCSIKPEAKCAGEYFGHASQCEGAPCSPPTGACCEDFTCFITTEADCFGEYLGDDSTCDGDPCAPPPPIGACCVNFTCELTTQAGCAGQYLGDDTTCEEDPCAPATGACCEGEICLVSTEAECAGEYLGDDTTCNDEPCARPEPPVIVIETSFGNVVATPITDYTGQPNGDEVQSTYEDSGLWVYQISIEFDALIVGLAGLEAHEFALSTDGSIHNTDHNGGNWLAPDPEENFDDPLHALDSWLLFGIGAGDFAPASSNYLGFFGNVGGDGVFSSSYAFWNALPPIDGGTIMQIGYDNEHSVTIQFNIATIPNKKLASVSLTLPSVEDARLK